MRNGSVLVDIAVDRECFEATRPTTHSDPVFELNGSFLLRGEHARACRPRRRGPVHVTLPLWELARHGWRDAVVADDAWPKASIRQRLGHLRPLPSTGPPYTPLRSLL